MNFRLRPSPQAAGWPSGLFPPGSEGDRYFESEIILKTKTIARLIEQDLLREPEDRSVAAQCHACGRSYLYQAPSPNSDDNGRFCSARCRETYDAGLQAYEPNYVR